MKNERYYLTQSMQLARFVRRDGTTYIVEVNGVEKQISSMFLTFVPVEKLAWFKTKNVA